jgi:lysophospholipase L1-like esterase
MTKRKRALFIAVILLLFALLIEGALRVGAAVSPRLGKVLSPVALTIDDDRLGLRPNPEHRDHDRRGWRNPTALESAAVVVLGDSHTYGWGVPRAHAWPTLLAAQHPGVYSMAFGGYGPVRYRLLAQDAKALRPQRFIIGVYAGNDLCDAHLATYQRDLAPALRAPDRAEEFAALDEERPVSSGWRLLADRVTPPPPSGLGQTLRGLAEHTFSTRALSYVVTRLSRGARPAPDLTGDPAVLSAFEFRDRRTVFTAGARSGCLDLSDPRISRALAVSIDQLALIHDTTPTIVLGLPTREGAWCAWLEDEGAADALPAPVTELCRREAELWRRLKEGLAARGVTLETATAQLTSVFKAGGNPYFESWDGHPAADGHRAIAQAALAALARAADP